MATFNFTGFSDESFYDDVLLGGVGDTYTVTSTDYQNVASFSLEDNGNNVFEDNDDLSGTISVEDTSTGIITNIPVGGTGVELESTTTVSWTDGDGVAQETIFGRINVDDSTGDHLFITSGPLPPPGTELTITAVNNSPSGIDGIFYDDIVVCFTRGTMILTERGEVAVEALEAGDMVVTRDRGLQPLRWVGSRTVKAEGALAPITIKAGAFGNDRDLVLSPAHRVLVEGWKAEALFGEREVLATARQLMVRDDVFATEGGEVEYFHILFDNHEIVTANGAPSESLNPSDLALDHMPSEQRDEVLALFPELIGGKPVPAVRPTLRDTDIAAL
ncbi:Hint domain-containing protein [Oceanibium sediminis]|uniref:Hint domain-containing protein n=1 Tax=Oceanibium sediminis TaxID=2026339 RepID=UPI001E2829C6|nr:Hint domain-containing protein [Oceanibium sediminis]